MIRNGAQQTKWWPRQDKRYIVIKEHGLSFKDKAQSKTESYLVYKILSRIDYLSGSYLKSSINKP